MNRRPQNEKPRAVRRRALNNTGTWASTSRDHANADGRDKLCLALAGVDAARLQLTRYATATDMPAWRAVDAADLLDAAAACVADALTGGLPHGHP